MFNRKTSTPTGRVRHRVGFRKCLVMQVEMRTTYKKNSAELLWWRDARTEDLRYTEILMETNRNSMFSNSTAPAALK